MEIVKFLKEEFRSFGKYERFLFPLVLVVTVLISVLIGDNKIALVSALCGMSYTILAGKGKVSCYFIGIIGTFCYSYIAFINGFWGNLSLYTLYYLPMEIIGIFKWKKHLKRETREVVKTNLSKKDRYIYLSIVLICSGLLSVVLNLMGDSNPVIDATTTVMSVVGQLLTVKRCVEQWYIWFVVNLLSLVMWVVAYINGSNCFATIIMWAVYLVLSVYFLVGWKRELK